MLGTARRLRRYCSVAAPKAGGASGHDMMRRLLVVLAVQLVAVGCSGPSGESPHASPSTAAICAVSSLEKGPDEFSPFGLAHAGPIWFSAFGQVKPGTLARFV